MKQVFCVLMFVAAFIQMSKAQTAEMDSTFGADGVLMTGKASHLLYGRIMVTQPDGKIITTGVPSTGNYIRLDRFNSDGSLDSTFAFSENTGLYHHYSAGVGLQADGKILCTDGAYFLYRFNHNGLIDSTFGVNGAVPTFSVTTNKILTQANGKIVLVGYNLNAVPGAAPVGGEVLVYNPDGSLDSTFSDDGLFTYHASNVDWFFCAQIQPDGKILVAGSSIGSNSWRLRMLRLTPEGVLDSTFGVNGVVDQQLSGSTEAYGMALQADGKIVISGYEYQPYRAVVLRYLPDGSGDSTFGTNGVCFIPAVSEGTDVTILPDGKIMVYGWLVLNNQSQNRSALIQLLPNGTIDTSFGDGGKYFSPVLGVKPSMTMEKVANNKFVASGHIQYAQMLQQFLLDLNVGTLSPNTVPSNNVLLYPNPIVDNFNLKFLLDQSEQVSIDLFDITGKHVMELLQEVQLEAGEHEEALHLGAGLPCGNYVVIFSISGKPVKNLQITKN